jgi:methionyl-tRNA formyltransferase
MSVNMHPSLLPHLRGAFPAEWAILRGDASTGVTLVKMSAEFDKGDILARQEIAISPSDTRETLYRTLYDLGTKLLIATIPKIAEGNVRPQSQAKGDYFYARRLNRVDGFIPWNLLSSAMVGEDIPAGKRPALFQSVSGHWSLAMERAVRAFHGWPGIWTEIETRDPSIRLRAGMEQGTGKKRLKILGAHIEDNKLVLDTVQFEGKSPIPYKQLSVLFE